MYLEVNVPSSYQVAYVCREESKSVRWQVMHFKPSRRGELELMKGLLDNSLFCSIGWKSLERGAERRSCFWYSTQNDWEESQAFPHDLSEAEEILYYFIVPTKTSITHWRPKRGAVHAKGHAPKDETLIGHKIWTYLMKFLDLKGAGWPASHEPAMKVLAEGKPRREMVYFEYFLKEHKWCCSQSLGQDGVT